MDSLKDLTFASVAEMLFPLTSGRYAALALGLLVFLTIIFTLSFFTNILEDIALEPKALFYLNLNRLLNYPLGHVSLLHLLLNIAALYGPLSRFEMTHGTVYTGIVLNVLAMATAVPFCLVGIVFFRNVKVLGASAWVFSFAAYFAHIKSKSQPVVRINLNFSIPTLYSPVLFLLLVTILIPGSSFWGHLFGLIAGYLLAFKKLDRLVQPPTKKVVPFIESKIGFLIDLIPSQFNYLREETALTYRSLGAPGIIPTSVPPTPNPSRATFLGQGHKLGDE